MENQIKRKFLIMKSSTFIILYSRVKRETYPVSSLEVHPPFFNIRKKYLLLIKVKVFGYSCNILNSELHTLSTCLKSSQHGQHVQSAVNTQSTRVNVDQVRRGYNIVS